MSETDLTSEETAQFEAMMGEAPPPPAPPPPEPPKPEAPPPPPEQKAEQPEPPPAPPEKKPPEQPVRLVPHAALHEERTRRQQLERRIAELEAKNTPQPQGDEPPDETVDPIGAVRWLKAQRAKEQEERQRAQQEQAQFAQLRDQVSARVNAYAAEHPEYPEQVKFLREFRFRELTEGLGYHPERAAQQVAMEEVQLGAMAVNNDLDPGAMVSKLATVRGWKPKEAEPPPKNDPPKPTAAEQKIDRIAKGQRAGISPSGAGGSGPEPEMSAETLLSLEGAAFDKAWRAHGKRLMGG